MSLIYSRASERCVEHPHRPVAGRCPRCGRAFCAECLVPDARRADGTRDWFCAPCLAATIADRQAAAAARTWRGRVRRALLASRAPLAGLMGAALLAGALVLAVRSGSGGSGGLAAAPDAGASCGELSRVRTVGAVGLPGPAEAVNLLALPHRAAVESAAPGSAAPAASGATASLPAPPPAAGTTIATPPPGAASSAAAPPPAPPDALVDECDTGWRAPAGAALPASFLVTPARADAWLQRVVLWQDPAAPQAAWVKDFEVLASPSPAGDDFLRLTLDRPARLEPTREQQWFQAVQPAPAAGAPSERLDPALRARYGQPFPAAVPIRRLLLRVLSTHGEGAGVALGELAAFGPDLEIGIEDALCPDASGRPSAGCFAFNPREVRALAGRPMSVLFANRTLSPHLLASAGQDRNFEVRLEPGQVASGLFFAAGRPGRYDLICKIPGHDRMGLLGAIAVR